MIYSREFDEFAHEELDILLKHGTDANAQDNNHLNSSDFELYYENSMVLQRDLKRWAPGTCEYIGGQPTFKTEFIDKWNLKKLVTRLF